MGTETPKKQPPREWTLEDDRAVWDGLRRLYDEPSFVRPDGSLNASGRPDIKAQVVALAARFT